MCKNMY